MYHSPEQFSGRQWDSECYKKKKKNQFGLFIPLLKWNHDANIHSYLDEVLLKRGPQAPICIIPQTVQW